MDNRNKLKDLSYYLTLYKLEKHETWRAALTNTLESFENQAKTNKWPKVTEKQVLRIDRLTGTFSEI